MGLRDRWKTTIGVGLAVMLFGLTTSAFAQPPGGGPGAPGGPPPGPRIGFGLPELFSQLDLTADQITQIKALVESQRETRKASMDEARSIQQQINAAIYGGTATDASQLADLTTKLAELQKQGLEAEVALQIKIAALLTDTQRQQIAAAQASRAAGRRTR